MRSPPPQAQASASVTGSGLPDGTTFSASGHADNTAGSGQGDNNGFGATATTTTLLLFLGLNQVPSFTLSAHTVAVFSGTASLSASTTGGAEPNPPILIAREQATAGAIISATGPPGHRAVGLLAVRADASGVTCANAVPEPQSWAMRIAGLAAVGGLARRRHGGA